MKHLPGFFTMAVFTAVIFSCSGPEEKKVELNPSDSLKTVVAASLEAYASQLASAEDTTMIFNLLQGYLNQNKAVYGSAFALVPVIKGKDTLRSSPYIYRSADGYIKKLLEKSYDYTKDAWYNQPLSQKKGCWSEPYFDEGGGEVQMITYSVPIFKTDTVLLGVFTADLQIK